MKRTYVDRIAEYYDNNDDIAEEAYLYGLRKSDLEKVYRSSNSQLKFRFIDD